LMLVPGIKTAVVAAKSFGDASSSLVAYYTSDDVAIDADNLREHLARVLPDYMMPAQFIRLDALPLTPNGKLDRRALPDPGKSERSRTGRLPATETERDLLEIWRTVLKNADAGIDDNFFELGGHSLTAVRLVNAIADKFGMTLSFAAVLQAQTVSALAKVLLDSARFGQPAIDQPLVLLNEAGNGRPLFGFPPGTTDAVSYSHLAKLVPGRPLYAFNFLEEATGWGAYADRIGQVDPDAPCLLFGYSGGGNLAFRTARELEARGRPVAAIVMLDSSRFLEAFPISVDEARRLASDFLESGGVAPVAANAVLRDKVV